MFRQLSFGLLLTTQFVLWTAFSLVLLGTSWRNTALEPRILLFGLFVALTGILEIVCWRRSRNPRLLPESAVDSFVEPSPDEEEVEEEEFASGATQQIVRCRTEAGTERLEGTFLVEFEPLQRTVSVHVPFCPAFATSPTVDVLLLDGDATLSVIKPRPFGVRIDVKRRSDDDSVRILVVAVG